MSAPANPTPPTASARWPAEGVDPTLSASDLPATGVQSHAANLATLADGTLACTWFGGTQEGLADISVWFSRRAPGGGADSTAAQGWSAPQRLSADPARSEQNPILFRPPAVPGAPAELWLLHTAQRAGHQDTALVRRRISTDDGAHWGEPVDLALPAGSFVRQPPLVMADGRWLLPVFRCRALPGERWSGDDDDSVVYVSTDRGAHWAPIEVPGSQGCVHMAILPPAAARDAKDAQDTRDARDGSAPVAAADAALVAFFRSRWADWVYRSASVDGGRSWSAPQPTPLPNNNSSIQAIRLASGRLAMVYNHASAADATERRLSLYDEIEDDGGLGAGPASTGRGAGAAPASTSDTAAAAPAAATSAVRRAFWGAPRAPLCVAISEDEGLTWPWRRVIEAGDGYCLTNNSADKRNRELSYPSIHQSPDGRIHVAYTRHRQHIRHVAFDEAWVCETAS